MEECMLNYNKVYNEDCLITMSKMEDNSINCCITSPPYDNLRSYNGYSFDFENIAKELYRVLKPGGVIVWVVGDATINGNETGTSFKQALYFKEIGFNLYDTMIYQKTGTPFPQKKRYNQIFEYMFILSKGIPKTFNPIMKKNITAGSVRNTRKYRTKDGEMKQGFNKPINEYGIENNIWIIKNGMNKSTKDKIAFNHPAIFPEELVNKHLLTWTNEEDIVYDCFMGSGTVAKCCNQLNRYWIGSECSEEYCNIIKERLV